MKELPLQIQKSARRYEAIQVDGLTLYPIKVREYGEFSRARPAIEALQQSFPVRFMTMPLLQAYYQMDYEAAANGEAMTGLFSCAILTLVLALRLCEDAPMEERMRQIRIEPMPGNPAQLKQLSMWLGGEELVTVKPAQFAALRQIIAAQNGVKLYGDDANPDLVRAEQEIRAKSAEGLEGDIEDEIGFVAALSHCDESEIDEWPILKLQNRSGALRRVIDYAVCGINEGAGCTWKGGNPVPHPWLRKKAYGGGLVSASDFLGGAAERAIENEGQETSI